MKQPLAKLISVYRELDDYPGDGFGYVIDGIVDYLDGCKCCAFCKNYGMHDPCEPNDKSRDFKPCNCAWFSDKRDDEQYRLPNGTVNDFYKTIELG